MYKSNPGVAQLVVRHPSKVNVASSSLVPRSINFYLKNLLAYNLGFILALLFIIILFYGTITNIMQE